MKFNLIGTKEDLLSEILKKKKYHLAIFSLGRKLKLFLYQYLYVEFSNILTRELYQEDGWKTAQTRHGEGIFLKTI